MSSNDKSVSDSTLSLNNSLDMTHINLHDEPQALKRIVTISLYSHYFDSNSQINENEETESNISLNEYTFSTSAILNIPKSSYLNIANHLLGLSNKAHINFLTQFDDGIVLPTIVQYLQKNPIPNIVDNPISLHDRLINNMSTLYYLYQFKDQSINPRNYNFANEDDMMTLIEILIRKFILTPDCIEKMIEQCNLILSKIGKHVDNFDSNWKTGEYFIELLNYLSNGKFHFQYSQELTIDELKDMFSKVNCPVIIENDSILSNFNDFVIQYQIQIILEEIQKKGVQSINSHSANIFQVESTNQNQYHENKETCNPSNIEQADNELTVDSISPFTDNNNNAAIQNSSNEIETLNRIEQKENESIFMKYSLYSYNPSIVENKEFENEISSSLNSLLEMTLEKVNTETLSHKNVEISDSNSTNIIETTLIFSFDNNKWEYHSDNWSTFLQNNNISSDNQIRIIVLSPHRISTTTFENYPYHFLSIVSKSSIVSNHHYDAFVETVACKQQDMVLIAFQLCYKDTLNRHPIIDIMETFLENITHLVIALYPHTTISDSSHFYGTSSHYIHMEMNKNVCPMILLFNSQSKSDNLEKFHSIEFQKEMEMSILNSAIFQKVLECFPFEKPSMQWIDIDDFETYKLITKTIFEKYSKEYVYTNVLVKVNLQFGFIKEKIDILNSIMNSKDMETFLVQLLEIENSNDHSHNKEFLKRRNRKSFSDILGKVKKYIQQIPFDEFYDGNELIEETKLHEDLEIENKLQNALLQLCNDVKIHRSTGSKENQTKDREILDLDHETVQKKTDPQTEIVPVIDEEKIRSDIPQHTSNNAILTYSGGNSPIEFSQDEWDDFIENCGALTPKSKINVVMVSNFDNDFSKQICEIISGSTVDNSPISDTLFYATPIYCGTVDDIKNKFDLSLESNNNALILMCLHIPKIFNQDDRLYFENFIAGICDIISTKIDLNNSFIHQSEYRNELLKILQKERVQIVDLPIINCKFEELSELYESSALLSKDLSKLYKDSLLSTLITKYFQYSLPATIFDYENISMYFRYITTIVERCIFLSKNHNSKSNTFGNLTKYFQNSKNAFNFVDIYILKNIDFDKLVSSNEKGSDDPNQIKSIANDYKNIVRSCYQAILAPKTKEDYFKYSKIKKFFPNPSQYILNNTTLTKLYPQIKQSIFNKYVSDAAAMIDNSIINESHPIDVLDNITDAILNSKTLLKDDYIETLKVAYEDALCDSIFDKIKNMKFLHKDIVVAVYKKKVEDNQEIIEELKQEIDRLYKQTKCEVKKAVGFDKEQIKQNSMKYTLSVRESVKEVTIHIVNDEDLEKHIKTDF